MRRLKRLYSIILSIVMIILTINIQYEGKVYAASVLPRGLNDAIIDEACKYLGLAYKLGGRDVSLGYLDCTGLALKVLGNLGFSNIPEATGAGGEGSDVTYRGSYGWLYKIQNRTLSIKYKGVTFGYNEATGKHLNVVYVDTVDAFNNAILNKNNVGKMIVLKTAVKYSDLAPYARKGTMLLFPPCDLDGDGKAETGGHFAFSAGYYPANMWVDYLSTAEQKAVAYAEQVYNEMSDYRSKSKKKACIGFQLEYVSKLPYKTAIYRSSTLYSKERNFYLIANHGQPGLANSLDGIGSYLWRIEATTSINSVGFTNKTGGAGDSSPTYAVYFNSDNTYSDGIRIKNVNSGKNTGISSVKYAITTDEEIAKDIALRGEANVYSQTDSELELSVRYMVATSSENGYANFLIKDAGNEKAKTYYIAQLNSSENLLRDEGYYTVELSGSSNRSGKGTTITSVIYNGTDRGMASYFKGNNSKLPYIVDENDKIPAEKEDQQAVEETTEAEELPTEPETTEQETSEEIYVNPFEDVSEKAWYADFVAEVNKKGIMTGYDDKTFAPNDSLTRAMMVTLLWKMDGKPDADISAQPYKDVYLKRYYTKAVAWAKESGIISEYNEGELEGCFDPLTNITRQDCILMLYNYAKYKNISIKVKANNSYKAVEDASEVASYAKKAVNWGYERGYIGNNSLLYPGKDITRAEAAAIIVRFLNNI